MSLDIAGDILPVFVPLMLYELSSSTTHFISIIQLAANITTVFTMTDLRSSHLNRAALMYDRAARWTPIRNTTLTEAKINHKPH